MGYGDKKKWQKALGGQYGCLYIDEINTADIDFVRESAMRCDYLMATLNPSDPNLDIYKEYINCSRPLPEWEEETPKEIKDELREEPDPGGFIGSFLLRITQDFRKRSWIKSSRTHPKGLKSGKIRLKV